MNIQYFENSRTFKLDTKNSSYIIGIADEEGFLGHVYYGAGIGDADVAYLLRMEEEPFPPSRDPGNRSAFLDAFPAEYPGSGVGDYRESALEIRDHNGNCAIQPCYQSHRIYQGKPGLEGLPAAFGKKEECMTLELSAYDRVLAVELILFYSLFADSEVIARSVRIVNHAEHPVYLEKVMSMSLDMEQKDYRMLSLHGRWAGERTVEYRTIGYGRQDVGSFRGRSSHQEHPFIALVSETATWQQGEVYGFHFVYSGNFYAGVEKNQYDLLRISMGIHPRDFCWQLKPGEEFCAPEVLLVYSSEGLGAMTRSFHDLFREHLIRSPYGKKKRPVLINNWEATYFDFNAEKLLEIARKARQVGIEMLVMDDGWFGHREDERSSLGDWQVNEKKLGISLKSLVDSVNDIGLKFGMWFEPEMISPDSELYRKHPDWAIALPGRKPCLSRNQYVLDLSRPAVVDFVYESVAKILRSANVEYVKWDMNRSLCDLGSLYLGKENQGELSHRYVLAVYELQERLMEEFPGLLLENCSSGGGRFDPGMLYYSPQIWCSDITDAIERLSIQEGTALLYPLCAMGAHVTDCPDHVAGRKVPFETRGHIALAGAFGYELDITKLSDEELEMIPKQIALYHQYQELICRGDYYRIASWRENGFYDCYEVAAKDRSEALITFVQVLARPNKRSERIRLLGLASDKKYWVEGSSRIWRGDTLQNAGLLMPSMKGDFRSCLIHVTEI